MSGNDVVQGGRAAFVGNVRHRDARGAHQEFGVEVMRHARPDRCERELPGPCLCVCDQLQQRMDRERRIDDQYERHSSEAGERNEIGCRIVGKLFVERDIDRHRRARRHEQHVSVRSGFGDGARRDDGARPGPILDHEGLAEPLLQLLGEHAGDDVGASARREGHDDSDGARRVVLCPRQRRGEKSRNSGPGQTQESTTAELHSVSHSKQRHDAQAWALKLGADGTGRVLLLERVCARRRHLRRPLQRTGTSARPA